jgi:porphyrinogen peroxidase
MTPQNVIVPPPKATIFLVVTLRTDGENGMVDLLSDIAGLTRSVGRRSPEDLVSCVVGIGAVAWDRLYPSLPRPAGLHPFTPVAGDRHEAPATPGDLLFHVRAQRFDLCFELIRHIVARLAGLANVVDEVHGFRYFDERDLLGFVDGTENPAGAEAEAAVLVADPPYAGGSYVVVQKYLHDLDRWEALTIEEQERVIGRRKLSDIELPDGLKPSNSHVALNTITDADGAERKIIRDNMVFGHPGSGEYGTYFIGYASDPAVIERMLRNMFVGDPAGNHDRILDFSTAITGGLFFVPPSPFLDDPNP